MTIDKYILFVFKVSVEMFYSASGSSQFDKTPFHIKTSLCNFMNTSYREYFMNGLKTISNFPSGNILCPIEAVKNFNNNNNKN